MARLALGGVVALLPWFAPASADEVFVNALFGIMVPIPSGLHMCTVPDERAIYGIGQNHGTIIFLDPAAPQICGDWDRYRAIDHWAYYNVFYGQETLADFKESECEEKHCEPAPKGLRIDNWPSASYRVNHPDGWIEIVVLTQFGHGGTHYPDDPKYAVNYKVHLNTDAAHLEEDLRLFRAHLPTLRLIPLEPTREEIEKYCRENKCAD